MHSRKIAYIDLSSRTIETRPIPLEWRRRYIGGRGINAYLLSELIKPPYDPLAPENPLLIGAGYLNGLPGFGGSRVDISALSPASGNLGSSNVGGSFGAQLKYAGFDHLVITGRSPHPVYLLIRDGDILIKDAGHLWGRDTWETQQAIRQENGDPRLSSLVIGIAGEKKVRLACVINGPKGAAGRYGLGAVMGSKNLKAISARGWEDVWLSHPQEFLTYFRQQMEAFHKKKWTRTLARFGTPLLMAAQNESGFLYSRSGLGSPLGERARSLYAENMERYSLGMAGCSGCTVHCRHRYFVKEGRWSGLRGEGPEFLSLLSLGYYQENVDLESVIYAAHLCNRYGLDVGDAGQMIAFAFSLYDHELIGQEESGRPLTWGDGEAVISLIDDMANRRGLGDVLAEGANALKQLQPEAKQYLPVIKNALFHTPHHRAIRSLALCQAVSTIPGHQHRGDPVMDSMGLPEAVLQEVVGAHVSSDFRSYEGKAHLIWWQEIINSIADSLGVCRFQTVWMSPTGPKFEEFRQMLRLTAGIELSEAEQKEIGERIYTLERLILCRLGVGTRPYDILPEHFLRPLNGGKFAGEAIDRDKMEHFLDEYYAVHGWDGRGVPTPQTLQKLGIEARDKA